MPGQRTRAATNPRPLLRETLQALMQRDASVARGTPAPTRINQVRSEPHNMITEPGTWRGEGPERITNGQILRLPRLSATRVRVPDDQRHELGDQSRVQLMPRL